MTSGVTTELAPGELTLPGDVAVAPNGTGYVTNRSAFSGGGQVVTVADSVVALRRPPRWLRWPA